MTGNEKGFTLVEILVSIFILSLIAAPVISMLSFSVYEYREAGERTKQVYAVQGLLEQVLNPTGNFPVTDQEFKPHPQRSQYEYRITVTPHYGASLNMVTVELRAKDNPEQILEFTTLKARRKLYVPVP